MHILIPHSCHLTLYWPSYAPLKTWTPETESCSKMMMEASWLADVTRGLPGLGRSFTSPVSRCLSLHFRTTFLVTPILLPVSLIDAPASSIPISLQRSFSLNLGMMAIWPNVVSFHVLKDTQYCTKAFAVLNCHDFLFISLFCLWYLILICAHHYASHGQDQKKWEDMVQGFPFT